MYVTAILLAAGKGERLKSSTLKPFVCVNSHPLLAYSLAALNQHPLIKDIIVVVNPDLRDRVLSLIEELGIKKIHCLVSGGQRRQDSLGCGLKALPQGTEIVLIHDAARPFLDAGIIRRLISAAKKYGAAIAGIPVVGTLKRVSKDLAVQQTVDRKGLYEAQTPQVFQKRIILDAYARFKASLVTDDAMLVEKLNKKVVVVPGSRYNIKVTFPDDLVIAEGIARFKKIRL